MKQSIFLLFTILASVHLSAQKFPVGTWSIVTDSKGNSMDIKNAGNVQHQLTSFEFQEGVKYSFSLEEFDSSGRKTLLVKEYGVYSVTPSQFTLTPAASTTTFYDYIGQSTKPVGNSAKQNSLGSAAYHWIYQKEKEEKLTIVAVKPGYREGIISGGNTRAAPRKGGIGMSSLFRQSEPVPERSRAEHSH